jgi:UPF0716 protein FxsA
VWILLLFVIGPIVELTVLIEVGTRVGGLQTGFMCLLTAAVGGTLAKRQGMATLWRIRQSVEQGILPQVEMMSGALIVAAGILLFIPGFVSDAMGLLLLLPPVRSLVGAVVYKRIQARRQWQAQHVQSGYRYQGAEPIDDGQFILPPGEGPTPPRRAERPIIIIED